jgi:hypothetical protein
MWNREWVGEGVRTKDKGKEKKGRKKEGKKGRKTKRKEQKGFD